MWARFVGVRWIVSGRRKRRALRAHAGSFSGVTHLQVPAEHPLRVGDMVGLGVSHLCTTFDKWKLIYLVDADYQVVDAIQTFF
jgi:D-serine deaminase-like pyridoxal phosphate-dependent protein